MWLRYIRPDVWANGLCLADRYRLPSAARSRSQWRHTRMASRLIRVFSGVYSWFHLQCVFGVFLGVGRGWQVVMILGPDHEPPVLSQSSGRWLMTPGDDD